MTGDKLEMFPQSILMNYLRRSRLNFLAFAACALCTLPLHAAILAPEKILPEDTLVVVTAPDFSKLRELYLASPQSQLWNDPAMKGFKDKFMSKWNEEFVQPLERDLGVKLADYKTLPQGQLTFAITQNGWPASESQPGLLLLLDAKGKSSQLKTNLAQLRKKWLDSGKALKTEKIRDLEFFTLPFSDKDIPPTIRKLYAPTFPDGTQPPPEADGTNAAKTELIIGQFESLLIAGTSEKAVEKAVAHLTGGAAPALAEVPTFEANRLAVFRDAPCYCWVNAQALVDLLGAKPADKDAGESPFAMLAPQKLLAATGLNGLKTLAVAAQTSGEGTLARFFLGVPEASRDGVFKLFPNGAKEASPPPFVPADAVKFQRWRVDGQGAWAVVQKILGDISPQITGSLNFILDTANEAARQKDPDFDIKKNLFGNLGDDVMSYEKAPRGTSLSDLNNAPGLLLLGSPNAEQLAGALKGLFAITSQAGGTPTEREFLGHKIYSVPAPQMPFSFSTGPAKSAPASLSYTACGGYVALTTDAAMIEEFLRSSGTPPKPLRETPGLTDAAASVGGLSTGWFGFENQAETTRSAFEALRGAATNSATAPTLSGPLLPAAFKEWADFSLLPPFDKIAKYFSFSVFTGSAGADGLTFRIFSPTPPQLKK